MIDEEIKERREKSGNIKAAFFTLLSSLFLFFLITGCRDGDPNSFAPPPITAPATVFPTPTLLPALAAVEPTPTATADGSFVEVMVDTAVQQIVPSATATPSPTTAPTSTPTATPQPSVRLQNSRQLFHNGNYDEVVAQLELVLEQRSSLSHEQQVELLYTLGRAYWWNDFYTAASRTFTDLITLTEGEMAAAHFYLGQAQQAVGNNSSAINAYQEYLQHQPNMAAYVQPRIAQLLAADGRSDDVVPAYEAALSGNAPRLREIDIRRQLAQFYLDGGDFAAAIAQYDAIRDLAFTEFTKGEMTYLAGVALLQSGDSEGAYGRFQSSINLYPRAYESYLGLIELVEGGAFANEYQRGLVDYYADAYEPAVGAFSRYIATHSDNYNADAHLYLAYSYEALGNLPAAYTELDKLGLSDPAKAIIEQAKMAARAGDTLTAIDRYANYLRQFPEGEDAPFANWWLAALTERSGDWQRAIGYFTDLAANYDWHEDAAEATFRAGWLATINGQTDQGVWLWLDVAEQYPRSKFASAAQVWLLRTLPDLVVAQANAPVALAEVGSVTETAVLTSTKPISVSNNLTGTDVITAVAISIMPLCLRARVNSSSNQLAPTISVFVRGPWWRRKLPLLLPANSSFLVIALPAKMKPSNGCGIGSILKRLPIFVPYIPSLLMIRAGKLAKSCGNWGYLKKPKGNSNRCALSTSKTHSLAISSHSSFVI